MIKSWSKVSQKFLQMKKKTTDCNADVKLMRKFETNKKREKQKEKKSKNISDPKQSAMLYYFFHFVTIPFH